MAAEPALGRRFSIQGRVQGVGYRDFTQKEARRLDLKGYARNLPDGSVLVFAVGSRSSLDELESLLRRGPSFAAVSGISVEETAPQEFDGFRVVA